MTSMWARICELCGAVAAAQAGSMLQQVVQAPEGWLHQDLGLLNGRSIDVCAECCGTKTIGELRDKLAGTAETAT
jgi:hypothetical protein